MKKEDDSRLAAARGRRFHANFRRFLGLLNR